jgi:hypothetical protein
VRVRNLGYKQLKSESAARKFRLITRSPHILEFPFPKTSQRVSHCTRERAIFRIGKDGCEIRQPKRHRTIITPKSRETTLVSQGQNFRGRLARVVEIALFI